MSLAGATTAAEALKSTAPSTKSNVIFIHPCQKGNPVIQCLSVYPYEYSPIQYDYLVGAGTVGILYISLKYHRLYPDYIHERFSSLLYTKKLIKLRVLLCLIDVQDHEKLIFELTRASILHEYTLLLVWNTQEAARYIETFKKYENKNPEALKERPKNDHISQAIQFLTSIKSVSSTDAIAMLTYYGSLKNIANSTKDELLGIPGLGETKIRRILEAFKIPFLIKTENSNG